MKNSVKVIIFLLTILVYTNAMVDRNPAFVYSAPSGIPIHTKMMYAKFKEKGFYGIYELYYHDYNAQFVGPYFQKN